MNEDEARQKQSELEQAAFDLVGFMRVTAERPQDKLVYTVSGIDGDLRGYLYGVRPDLNREDELAYPLMQHPALIHIAQWMRHKCYSEEIGTWYSFICAVEPSGKFNIDFDYKSEPIRGINSFYSEDVMADMAKFAAPYESWPEWLKSFHEDSVKAQARKKHGLQTRS